MERALLHWVTIRIRAGLAHGSFKSPDIASVQRGQGSFFTEALRENLDKESPRAASDDPGAQRTWRR
jgi:hypothetical protein